MYLLQLYVMIMVFHVWIRFEKRIYIPLPDKNARTEIFKIHIGNTPNNLTDNDFRSLGAEAEGLVAHCVFCLVILDICNQKMSC